MQIERQLQGTLNTIFTEEIKSRRLENRIFPYSVQEEGRADITLKNSKGRQIFFIELKDPTAKDGRSIFDSNVLQRELERAQLLEIDYFGVCNFTAAALLDTKKMYEKNAVTEGFFTVAEIARLSVNYVPTNEIQRKLRIIANFYLDCAVEIIERKTIKFTPIDELFIFKIRNLIEIYAYGITENVWEKYKSNKQFKKEISDYAGKQHWSIPNTYEEIENITYISLLMLISKLIFYKTYNDKNIWKGLSPIIIDDDIDTAKKLEEILWDYFHEFMKITSNFELLIGIRDDIIFRIPFVSDNSIELVRSVINAGAYYNFSDAKYDVIGRIFEELIHEDERHKLGQYFTPPNVVDLINTFAIRSGREKIFDPSCGSGTFLVRAYERKKKLNPKMHSALLEEIYGNDVSDYPAYLSMLNLAVRNISKHSYPKIIHSDFFSIVPSVKLELLNQRGEKQRRYLPQFDAIIGNPPYTRQEDIGSLQGLVSKDTIQNLIKTECGFTPSQRTSIYVYFFYHVAAFLKEGGYLAYICSNSWLDVDYGTDLQQWMLRHFEIVAIMDSEVERFFPAASVNTSIVILRKCKDEDKRNSNTVKFIYFKANLADILKKYKNADTLIAIFEKADNTIENDFFKITCIEQKELLNESKWGIFLKAPDVYFDILKKGKGKLKILGTKKGIANIFYGLKTGCNEFFYIKDITKTSKNNIVFSIVNNIEKFRSIAEIRKNNLRIVQNGLNEIWLIENDFVKPAIKTTKEINSYWIDKVSEENHLLSVGLIENYYNKKKKEYDITKYRRDLKENYPYLFSYIVYGEKNKTDDVIISEKPTCKSRPAWWDLGIQNKKDFILLQFRDKRNWTPIIKKQILIGNVVFIGNYQNKSNSHIYNVSLNSAFTILQTELTGRVNLGDGLLTTYGPDLEIIKVLEIQNISQSLNNEFKKVNASFKNQIAKAITEEIGTENPVEVDLEKVEKFRLNIDHLFLKSLGYNNKSEREEILVELYKSILHFIKSRFFKARSLNSVKNHRNKIEFSVYIEQLKQLINDEQLIPKNNITFAKRLQKLVFKITADSRLQKKILESYWQEAFNEQFDELMIANKDQGVLFYTET